MLKSQVDTSDKSTMVVKPKFLELWSGIRTPLIVAGVTTLHAVSVYAQPVPSTPPQIGGQSNSGFERQLCSNLLKDHVLATEPRNTAYFDFANLNDPRDCTRLPIQSGAVRLLRTLQKEPTEREKCVDLNIAFRRDYYQNLEAFAQTIRSRIAIHDSILFESHPDLFTPGCKYNSESGGKEIDRLRSLSKNRRRDSKQSDRNLLESLHLYSNEVNRACEIRSNAPISAVKGAYAMRGSPSALDRDICHKFLVNYNEWKRLNTVREKTLSTTVPADVDVCAKFVELADCSWTQTNPDFRLRAFASPCLKDAYIKCATGGNSSNADGRSPRSGNAPTR